MTPCPPNLLTTPAAEIGEKMNFRPVWLPAETRLSSALWTAATLGSGRGLYTVTFGAWNAEILSLPLPVDADADDRWARGQVFVLSGFGTWLAGIYAQDMVRAFGRISSGRALDSEVESRFESTFPIVPIYVQSYKTSEHLPSIREPPWQELCLGVHDGESNMECVLDGLVTGTSELESRTRLFIQRWSYVPLQDIYGKKVGGVAGAGMTE
ncbi:hypothetical protein B0H13DRAFT_1887195 [Mycena leptocephala]|nr:hypothetical protein B0H13DRAFT_1887195 [Mycena leptocephala]